MAHALESPPETARRLRLRGRVQGVGLRPALWRLARELGLRGRAYNAGADLIVEAAGPPAALAALLRRLPEACPQARIDAVEEHPLGAAPAGEGFTIAPSRPGGGVTLPRDTAPCPDCLRELHDPADRRHRYPFIACARCGPRLSALRALPYDRARTTLDDFPPCPDCAREYGDPANRRFHAEALACPRCGPRAWLTDRRGRKLPAADPIAACARRLRRGEIVAIRGVGAFHLACDARDAEAVARLRRRKHRPHKPLALLLRDLDQARAWVRVDEATAAALADPAAPIVLLPARRPEALPGIAPGLAEWGVMLPPSPLHHLLMAELDGPLVLTSGNRAGEPPCVDNDEALARLGDIADAFLLHDRPIVQRLDDPVLRPLDGACVPLRLGRGLAPVTLPLPPGLAAAPDLTALGGDGKNAPCLVHAGHALLLQHVGDLDHPRALADRAAIEAAHARLLGHRPRALAVDRHPSYRATREGRARAENEGLPLVAVQHHHAHFAACLGEHGVAAGETALGIVLDGTGLGDDDTPWGAEILLGDYRRARRLARLRPVPLPGGDACAREPWRAAYAHLHAALGAAGARAWSGRLPALRGHPTAALARMLARGLHCPAASSAGRLFDAVAAVLGLAPARLSHEAQAALALEAAVDPAHLARPYPLALDTRADPWTLDPAPLWRALLADLEAGRPTGEMAARFHAGLAGALAGAACALARRHRVRRVALSGGVFANRVLLAETARRLRRAGLHVLSHRRVPPNDAGLAYGQALVAAARLCREGG